jgi:hypothetical protein
MTPARSLCLVWPTAADRAFHTLAPHAALAFRPLVQLPNPLNTAFGLPTVGCGTLPLPPGTSQFHLQPERDRPHQQPLSSGFQGGAWRRRASSVQRLRVSSAVEHRATISPHHSRGVGESSSRLALPSAPPEFAPCVLFCECRSRSAAPCRPRSAALWVRVADGS